MLICQGGHRKLGFTDQRLETSLEGQILTVNEKHDFPVKFLLENSVLLRLKAAMKDERN